SDYRISRCYSSLSCNERFGKSPESLTSSVPARGHTGLLWVRIMIGRVLLVTGSDAAFFPMVRGTIRSVRDKPQGQQVVVAFFDRGCTSEQRRWLREQVDEVREPGWDFEFPNRIGLPGYVRAQLARPFLPKYFPGYDLYFWLDADAWVQDWSAVELLVQGAQ